MEFDIKDWIISLTRLDEALTDTYDVTLLLVASITRMISCTYTTNVYTHVHEIG